MDTKENAEAIGRNDESSPDGVRLFERTVAGVRIQPIPAPNLDPAEQPAPARSAPPHEADKMMARAYLHMLREKSVTDADWFPRAIKFGMDVVEDEGALLDVFHVSRATLKRWRSGDTMPGQLARESVINRLDRFVCARFDIAS